MAAHTYPGIGLVGGRSAGEDGWAAEMNTNLQLLSTAVQLVVLDTVATEPVSPTNGDIYIDTGPWAGGTSGDIVIRDEGAWVAITPAEGWMLYEATLGQTQRFNGTAWEEFSSGTPGGGSGGVFTGAKALQTTGQVLPSGVNTALVWDTAGFDEGTWFNVSNPTRLTVPAGVSHVELTANVKATVAQSSTTDWVLTFYKNGVSFQSVTVDDQFWGPPAITTGPVEVVEGDYFEVYLWVNSTPTLDIAVSFFSVNALSGIGGMGISLSEETASFNVTDAMLSGGGYKDVNSASAVVVTVPPDLVGVEPCVFERAGAGTVTFAAGAGVTINSKSGLLAIADQYTSVTLIPKGSNVFSLQGNLG